MRFIEHTKEGLTYYRAHKARNRERQAELEKTYRYKLDYARNHNKPIPEPITDEDIAYYSQQLGVSGPYADTVTAYLKSKGNAKDIKKLKIRIVNAKRELAVSRDFLVKTHAHLEKNKDAWGISDEQAASYIATDEALIEKYENELAEAMDELMLIQPDDGEPTLVLAGNAKSDFGRDQRIRDAHKTYKGPRRGDGFPKNKGPRGFREHSGISDVKLDDLRRLKLFKK